MPDLLDKRLLFVTGKGGVGKSTVAAALGLLGAARAGSATIVCEVVAAGARVARRSGARASGSRRPSSRRACAAISIDPQRALEEYLRVQVGNRALFKLLFQNRVFQYFAAAAPGAKELVTMGKVWELAQLDRPWTAQEPATTSSSSTRPRPATGSASSRRRARSATSRASARSGGRRIGSTRSCATRARPAW